MPYYIADIVKCEADEIVSYRGEHARLKTNRLHCVACAEPACLLDKRPTPGALCLTFPSGTMPEVSKLGDILLNDQLKASPVDWLQAPAADDFSSSSALLRHPA